VVDVSKSKASSKSDVGDDRCSSFEGAITIAMEHRVTVTAFQLDLKVDSGENIQIPVSVGIEQSAIVSPVRPVVR